MTQTLATLAQTTHLNSGRALKSSDYCRSFVSSQVITPGAFSFNEQYNIPGVAEERRAINSSRQVSVSVTRSLSLYDVYEY